MLKLCPAMAAIFDFQLALKHIYMYFINNHKRIIHRKLNFKLIVSNNIDLKLRESNYTTDSGIQVEFWIGSKITNSGDVHQGNIPLKLLLI